MKTPLRLAGIVLMLLAAGSLAANDKPAPSCCSAALTAGTPLSDKSLYQVESHWTNDAGKVVTLGELKGRPQIVAMFFTSCQYACPALVHDLMRIEAALPENLRTNLGCTLISFDPKRDTPAALTNFRQSRNLPDDRWTLLSGNPDDILELAALLGVRYQEDATGQFNHSNIITVLDANGEIVHQQIGLNQDIAETVRILQKLLTQ